MSKTVDADDSEDATEPVVDPGTVGWETAYEEMGHGPDDGFGMAALPILVKSAVDAVGTDEQAYAVIDAALDAGCLERGADGIVVAGYADVGDGAAEAEPDPESEDVDGAEEDDDRERTTRPRAPEEMPRGDLEAEVQELREDVDELQTFLQRDLSCIKGALRQLFGVDGSEFAVQDLPQYAEGFRTQLDDRDQLVQDVGDKLEIVDDLDSGETTSKRGKIAQLRQYCVDQSRDGAGSVDYKEAKGALGVSDSYAAKLLSAAAEHPWFYTKKPGDRTQLRVDLGKVPDGHVFRGNNAETAEETPEAAIDRGNNGGER